MYAAILRDNQISLILNGKQFTVKKDDANWDAVLAAHAESNEEKLIELLDIAKQVFEYVGDHFYIENDNFFWNGELLNNTLTRRIVTMAKKKLPIGSLIKFLEKLLENPSKHSVEELYGFLDKGQMPLTDDGDFLAYKKVRADYTDCHSGRIDNSVGKVVKMKRFEVDDNRNNHCSTGLHFCSFDYLKNFRGERLMIVKINPKNVVSVPTDYNFTKGRCCEYEVVNEVADFYENKDKVVLDISKEYQQQLKFAGPPVREVDGKWFDKDGLYTYSPEEYDLTDDERKALKDKKERDAKAEALGLSVLVENGKQVVKDNGKVVFSILATDQSEAEALNWARDKYNLSSENFELLTVL
jgi:hypothetical protein